MISIDRIMPSVGDRTKAISVLLSPVHGSGKSRMGHAGTDDPADQCVARRGRNALEPGDHVPEHRPDQRPKDDGRRHQILVDQALADGVGDRVQLRPQQGQEVGGEVEEGGELTAWTGFSSLVATTVAIELAASWRPFRKSNARARTTRPTSSGRAISCIGVAIDQLWSITMPSISFATSSKASTMRSRCLKISRSTMNSSALLSRCD